MGSKFLFSFLLVLCYSSYVVAAPENLDELEARKFRLATSYWGKEYVENPTTLVWQPETMMYEDVTTGVEVWRLSSTNGIKNSLPDISWSHWSADGKRFSFGSHRATSANSSVYATNDNSTYQGTVMMMRADGAYLRPADNAPFEVYVHSRYLHWSPVEPDVYYGFGRNYAGEGLENDQLYKVTVGDTSISKQMILDLNFGGEVDPKKAISSDGTKFVVRYGANVYPITLTPSVSMDDADGWPVQRQLDSYWGNTPTDASYGLHDNFILGTGGNIEFYFIPEGYSSWWKFALSGSAADGGPVHTIDHSAPYDWGEIAPVFTGYQGGSTCGTVGKSPWTCDSDPTTGIENYLSHPGFDRWGKYVAGTNSQQYQAWGVWDLQNHSWVDANISAPHYNWHSDWEAWSDYFASSPSAASTTPANNVIYTVKYDGTDTAPVVNAHIRESLSTDYNSLPRVTQSPDGTKIVFHSDFLYEIANKWDAFYAVAYYPHPPEITSLTNNNGTYTIRFDWRTDQKTSRGYTQRGWPVENTNFPPPPRETKSFRLWRSSDGAVWTPIRTTNAAIFDRYNFSNGKWIGENYWTIEDKPGEGIWFYAVTAIENSGLESRTLSNIYSSTGSQTSAYPLNPKGKSNFYTRLPNKLSFTVTKQTTPGHYKLTWSESADPLIRYYNIYYSSKSKPQPIQNHRIASIPFGINSYLDWLADPNTDGYYLVTAVDSQGNESSTIPQPNINRIQISQ